MEKKKKKNQLDDKSQSKIKELTEESKLGKIFHKKDPDCVTILNMK